MKSKEEYDSEIASLESSLENIKVVFDYINSSFSANLSLLLSNVSVFLNLFPNVHIGDHVIGAEILSSIYEDYEYCNVSFDALLSGIFDKAQEYQQKIAQLKSERASLEDKL